MPKKVSSCEYPNCPLCKSKDVAKNGHARGKQRWRCKNCRYDFLSAITTRSYHFNYADLKLLSVLLYLIGVKPEVILKYVLQPVKKTMENEHIIYQWATKVIDGRVETRVKSKIEIIQISGRNHIESKIRNISSKFMNNELRSYMVYINLNNEAPSIVVATNGIKHINKITETPFWFSILQQVLLIGVNNNEVYSIFKTSPDADIGNPYPPINSRNYNYTRYCRYGIDVGYKDKKRNISEVSYSAEVGCINIEQEIVKKRQSRKEIGTNILICFDSSFDAPDVYIIDKAHYIKH